MLGPLVIDPDKHLGNAMSDRLRSGLAVIVVLLFAGCADFAVPVVVMPPNPEREGTEPTHFGKACAEKYFWVFSFGDSHLALAKANGGISEIATVETVRKAFPVNAFPFNVYQRLCTEVSGYP